jgi:hypothetical protein
VDININSSATNITQVTVDGNTDIQTVNVDGTDVWFKAPTALEVAQGFYTSFNTWIRGDAGNTSVAPGNRSEYSNTTSFRYVDSHTLTFSGYSISETSPLDSSPNNTAVFIQYGSDNPADISALKVNGVSITETDFDNETNGAIALGHTTTALESITSTGATFSGSTGNTSDHVHSMVLAGKWDVTDLGDSGTSSSSVMQPGDIIIGTGYASGDGYASTQMPNAWMAGPSLVLERQRWWYEKAICGIWCNKTSGNITATWTAPGGMSGNIVRLRHIGI